MKNSINSTIQSQETLKLEMKKLRAAMKFNRQVIDEHNTAALNNAIAIIASGKAYPVAVIKQKMNYEISSAKLAGMLQALRRKGFCNNPYSSEARRTKHNIRNRHNISDSVVVRANKVKQVKTFAEIDPETGGLVENGRVFTQEKFVTEYQI